jgi:IclR family transcriptional regulator, acetate operon repressor
MTVQMNKVRQLDPEEDGRKPRIQTAARTVSILLAISHSSNGLKAKEVSVQLELPRQVTYHMLHTLLTTGIIRKNDQNRYVLGLAAASIVDGFRRQFAAPEHLARYVRAAVDATGETAYASGWIDGQIAVLASAKGRSPVQAAEVPPGYSGHAHARATGKLLLAFSSSSVRDEYLKSDSLLSLTCNTITSPDELHRELQLIAERGYATDNEEFSEGLCCLAVPIQSTRSGFALGISVPTERFHSKFEAYLAFLTKIASGADHSQS